MDILIFARLLADLPPRVFQGILGARCLALFAQSCDGRCRVSSPALAPASGFGFCPAAFFRSPKSSVFAAMRSCLTETAFLYRSGPLRVGAFAVPLRFRFGQITRPVR